ncbi:MAG: SPOR domain-containing protein [Gammaproteobacteria bacterium]|nr:SPOR domain-containing protein [Gammaproteobacteria bacterium]
MRTVFLALLGANLLYFGWSHWVAPPERPVVNETLAKLPRLKLIEELPPQARAPHPTPTARPATACVSLGPFGEVDSAARAAAVLKARGFAPSQRAVAAETSQGWAVVAGGFANQGESDRALVTLERAGIKDALVMPSSAEAGRRLSLGLFSERARAEKRAQAVRRLGLSADVTERKIAGAAYWVDLQAPAGEALPVQDLIAEGVSGKVGVEPCPAGAPEKVAGRAGAAGGPNL